MRTTNKLIVFCCIIPVLFSSTAWASYCTAYSRNCDEYIYGIDLHENGTSNTIINTWGSPCNDYTLSSTSGAMEIGESYYFNVTTAITGYWEGIAYDGDRVIIWVDWNNDEDFYDSGEAVYSEECHVTGDMVFDGTFTVPANAVGGMTRMRVRLLYSPDDPSSACGWSYYGEVEDYNIMVSNNTGTITGTKFNDLDGDGLKDAGEPGLSDWEIFIDLDGDGQYDSGEPNATTESDGSYEITDVPAGTQTVAEVMQAGGWRQTYPGGTETHSVTVVENMTNANINFGNTTLPLVTTVTFSGNVEMDDGTPMEGLQVDLNLGGFPPTSVLTTTTDLNGYYEFVLDAPWTGSLSIDFPDGWVSHWTGTHTGIMTNITEDFVVYCWYDGGQGSASDPWQIRTVEHLEAIGHMPSHWDDDFALTNDIDLAGTTYAGAMIARHESTPFTGYFDGAGFSILNLQSNSGLFGKIQNAVIKNLGVENVNITLATSVGAICNDNHGSTIENCFSTGNISGMFDVGGICAWVHKEPFEQLFPAPPPGNTPVIRNCYSTVNVTLNRPNNWFPNVSFNSAGGLCAYAEGADLINNYTSGSVHGEGCRSLGGLDLIIDSGGLVGLVDSCNIQDNYSSGQVIDDLAYSNPGGLFGMITGNGSFGRVYWDNTVNPSLQGIGNGPDILEGKSTAELQTKSTYADWDFDNVWDMCDGYNYPRLKWEPRSKADISCPDGVELNDLITLCQEWLSGRKVSDIGPDGCDGFVDYYDWTMLGGAWLSINGDGNYNAACDVSPAGGDGAIDINDLGVFVNEWLSHSACRADIAPGGGDNFVDLQDFVEFFQNW